MVIFDILYLLVLLLSLPLWVKILWKKEYRRLLKRRFSPDIWPGDKKRLWLHAVSVGEVKSLRSLIERLGKEYQGEIVLSVTTPAGYEAAREDYPDIRVINAPLDFTFTIKKFLHRIDPEMLILNELELWPNWVLLTKKAHIPILLINGRISAAAFKRYRFFGPFLRLCCRGIDRLLVQAELYRQRFIQLKIPAEKIAVCGNIKAETASETAARLPAEPEIFAHLKTEKPGKRIITLASTHPSDEAFILPLLAGILEKFAVIMVPRHLGRLAEIEHRLKDKGICYGRWTQVEKIDLDRELLLVDSMGYLFHIFKVSDMVLMGGTFDQKIGGHNLYEPAALGKSIVGGPFYNNFPDIGRELEERGVYQRVKSPEEWVAWLNTVGQIDFAKLAASARAAVSSRKGSIECIIKEIYRRIR